MSPHFVPTVPHVSVKAKRRQGQSGSKQNPKTLNHPFSIPTIGTIEGITQRKFLLVLPIFQVFLPTGQKSRLPLTEHR